MKAAVPVVLALALLAVGTSSSLPAAEPPAAKAPDKIAYPYLIKPLPPDQLAALRAEFAASSKGVCAELNEYGFTATTHACPENSVRIDIPDEDAVIGLVGKWLSDHSRFTGITPKSELVIEQVTETNGCVTCTPPDPPGSENAVIAVRIAFKPQILADLPVEGDLPPLVVFANAKGLFRIDGFWLPRIRLPLETTISSEDATNRLLGTSLVFRDEKGNPLERLIDLRDVRHPASRVVFIKQSPHRMEVRLAWKIPVGLETLWTIYVDAITGEVLKSEPPK